MGICRARPSGSSIVLRERRSRRCGVHDAMMIAALVASQTRREVP